MLPIATCVGTLTLDGVISLIPSWLETVDGFVSVYFCVPITAVVNEPSWHECV